MSGCIVSVGGVLSALTAIAIYYAIGAPVIGVAVFRAHLTDGVPLWPLVSGRKEIPLALVVWTCWWVVAVLGAMTIRDEWKMGKRPGAVKALDFAVLIGGGATIVGLLLAIAAAAGWI